MVDKNLYSPPDSKQSYYYYYSGTVFASRASLSLQRPFETHCRTMWNTSATVKSD